MTLKRSARLAAYLILLALAAWDVYLLTVGQPATRYAEFFPGPSGPPIETIDIVYMPYLPAWYSLAALVPIAIGLMRDAWLPLAWLGLLLHLVVGGLLLFSTGFLYVPIIGLLAVAAGIVQWQASHRARWLLASAGGVTIVLLVGNLLSYAPIGRLLLVVGSLLALLLLRLGRPRPNRVGA